MSRGELAVLADAAAGAAWLRTRLGDGGGTLRTDSRAVQPGDAFIAWPGHAQDARRYVADALHAGAGACLVEAEGVATFGFEGRLDVAAMPDLKAACGAIADAWFGHPSRALSVVAVTGTNGKTSSAWWVAMALRSLGQRAGVIGTLGAGEPPSVSATGLTTPDPVTLHGTLRALADAGCAACAVEASSIGLVEERLSALHIEVALFTNFTRDHLDYHGSMPAYWAAKRRLFAWPGLRAAVVNVDDPQGAILATELQGTPLDLWTVSMRPGARLHSVALRYEARGIGFEVQEAGAGSALLATTLVGDYNVSNLLGALAALRALGHPLGAAARALSTVDPVPGRLQRIAGREVEVVVDYAHTPDALDKVLAALRPLAQARGGRLWVVFGCGGDRDATKRALMGGIAERGADRIVLTSDNPRSEPPAIILAQIVAGISAAGTPRVESIEDRHAAIAHAVAGAANGDVVLLAGKGHEDYQEIAGQRRPFSDIDEARAALASRESVTRGPTPTLRAKGAAT